MSKENKPDDLTLPLFERPFRQRVREGWETFLKGEAKLRQLIKEKADSEVIMEQLAALLSPTFKEVCAEVGFNGEKYDLILNLDGDWSRLFSCTYFQKQAPGEVLENWNIFIGRQSRDEKLAKYQLKIGENSVCAEDIQVWITWANQEAKVFFYCEELIPLLRENESAAYWIAYTMLDYAIGELTEMKYISELEIVNMPLEGPCFTLMQLLPLFMDNLSLSKEELFDAERYCQLYNGYQTKPASQDSLMPGEDAAAGLRRDVFVGSTCFISLLNQFLRGENRIMDTFHQDGIAAGYFCYPLHGFEGENIGAQILDFRDNSAAMIENLAGPDSFSYIGGAGGVYYGYLDFIAWDLRAVLDASVTVFQKSDIDWVMFHSFRQDVKGILLYDKK